MKATAATPCETAAALRREMPARMTEGRIGRVVWLANRADQLCPGSAVAPDTVRLKEQARAELAQPGEPDVLFAQAAAARRDGDTARACRWNDRALAELQRRSGPVAVRVRDVTEVERLLDADHVLERGSEGPYVVSVSDGRMWGPMVIDGPSMEPTTEVAGVSPDGKTIALLRKGEHFHDSNFDRLELRAWETGAVSGRFDVRGPVNTAPDGKHLVFTVLRGERVALELWDWAAARGRVFEPGPTTKNDASIDAYTSSEDGSKVAVSWREGPLVVFDAATASPLLTVPHAQAQNMTMFEATGTWIAWGSSTHDPGFSRGPMRVARVPAGAAGASANVSVRPIDMSAGGPCLPTVLTFVPNRTLLLAGNEGGTACITNLTTGTTRRLGTPIDPISHPFVNLVDDYQRPHSVSLSADGRTLSLAISDDMYRNHLIREIDVATGRVREHMEHENPDAPSITEAPTRTPDGSTTLRRADDDVLVATDTATGRELWRLPDSGTPRLSPDGRAILDLGKRVIDTRTGKVVATRGTGAWRKADASPKLQQFAVDAERDVLELADSQQALIRLNLAKGILLERRPAPEPRATLHLDPRPFWSGASGAPCVWLDGTKLELSTEVKTGWTASAISADGSRVAMVQGQNGKGVVWDALGRELQRFTASSPDPQIAFSPNRGLLAYVDGSGAAQRQRVLEVESGEVQTLGDGWGANLSFGPDGRVAAVQLQEGVRLFEMPSGNPLSLISHARRVRFGPRAATQVWAVDGYRIRAHSVATGAPTHESSRQPEDPTDPSGTRDAVFLPGRSLLVVRGETHGRHGEDPDENFYLVDAYAGLRVGSLRLIDGGLFFSSADGRVDLVGDVARLRAALTCRVAGRVFPFDVCEDIVRDDGLLASTIAAAREGVCQTDEELCSSPACADQFERRGARSCGRLAKLYEGIYADRSDAQVPEKTHQLYEKACSGRDAASCRALAIAEKNRTRGAELFGKACEAGDQGSCADLGAMYTNGDGVAKDEKRGAELFKRACDGGSSDGCGRLGAAYALGTGVAQDDARAFVLVEQACKDHSSQLAQHCFNLGVFYRDGKGVARDATKALSLFNESCNRRALGACSAAGYLYETGAVGKKDEVKAATLYERACNAGDPWGCGNLGELLADGRGGKKRDEAKAAALFEQACTAGIPFVCANLEALRHEKGLGVPQDATKAMSLYEKACSPQDNPWPCARLAKARSERRPR